MSNIKEFINDNIAHCIKENKEDAGTLIGLPHPYTVPSVGHFDELYYWDTYFFNKGLGICGRMELAKNNVDNMLYLVNKYGYTDIAKRIAQKYVTLADRVFEKTGNLWEKYNVIDGNLDVSNEYGLPPMMGWSAGVYLASEEYLKQKA